MKFALIIDAVWNIESYYVKDNVAYNWWTDKPYSYNHSVDETCYLNTWNYPWLFEDGCFLNWYEFKDKGLPNAEYDVIFLVLERSLCRESDFPYAKVENIRNQYPNAKVVGFIKEMWMGDPYNYDHPKQVARKEFLSYCDAVVTNRPWISEYLEKLNDSKPFHYIAQPHNIGYFYPVFSGDKDRALWAYLPNPSDRRSDTYDFAKYLCDKYDVEFRYKPLTEGQAFDYMPLKEFVQKWSSCLFHLNMDPITYFPGNQITQVISTGTIHLGGLNDNHRLLTSDAATNDRDTLEDIFKRCLEDKVFRDKQIVKAWTVLNKHFSFNVVRDQIMNLNYGNEKAWYNFQGEYDERIQ